MSLVTKHLGGNMLLTTPRTTFEPVHSMLMQSISSKAVIAAVRLALFDQLEGEGKSVADLAEGLNLVADRLEPLLDILVAASLVEKRDGRYVNTAMGSEFLVTGKPLYQGLSMELTMQFIGTVDNSIAELVSGEEIDRNVTDDKWSADEVMEGTAQDAMGSGLVPVVKMVTALPGFEDFRTMCDIGGNHGMYSMGILEQNPRMNGVIFDLPHVAEQARKRCASLGFGERVTTQGIDFRTDQLPEMSFDLALTSHVLYAFKHDLDNGIKRIAESLKPGGWFVSHHYAGRDGSESAMTTASLELLTRLCGYPSHFIEQEELTRALLGAGFDDVRSQLVSEKGMGLIVAAQKKS